jgi:TolB-like protein/tRNA A-37 threonylcarbamoyl transferase component Bud32/Tfp pilus assembly protein PilF
MKETGSASLPESPAKCKLCGATARLDKDTCLNCLLVEGLDAQRESSSESFESVLAEIDLPDKEWRLGNYEILEEIGRGGMGVIYRARQRHSRRIVAVKRMLSYEAESHETLARFRREAETASSLDHPNILPIYEVSESDERVPFFSMKLATGGSLRAAAPALSTKPKESVRLIAKVARALDYAHQRGILHRDLQPGNILLDARGEPMISDFGLAKWLDGNSDLTRTLTTFGTPGYIAPEQAEGSATALTSAADIYSLGAILFNLLVGRPPFVGANALSVIRQAGATEAPRLRALAPSLDRDLETIIAHCLERDPKARYRSAADLADDLEHWLAGRPIVARPVLAPARIWRWSRRNPMLAAAAGACLLLILAVGGLLIREHGLAGLTGPATPPPEKSVAVLPFENLTPDQEGVFFTAGMQDDILTSLAKVADLKVIGRSSVRDYKPGAPRKLDEIARALGVRHVLEGSVRRVGDQVRISAHLTDARTGVQLWAEQYDRELADVFAVQAELAQAIADQLRVRLSPIEKAAMAKRPTTDLVAYDLYVEAKELLGGAMGSKDPAASMKRAVKLLDEATQRDPSFVLAYCHLARANENLYWNDLDHTAARIELAKRAVDQAVRLGPDLGETHLATARFHYIAYRGDDSARDELELARRALPNDTDVLALAGLLERRQNRWPEALTDLRKANELDPRNGEIVRALADTYLELRRYKEMELLLKGALSKIPRDAIVLYAKLADCYLARGDPKSVLPFFKLGPPDGDKSGYGAYYRFTAFSYLHDYDSASKAVAVGPSNIPDSLKGPFCPKAWFEALIAQAQQETEIARTKFADARAIIQSALGKDPEDPVRLSVIARIDAALGRKDDAIREAKEAVALRPLTRDAMDGPMLTTSLALVYAWTGERDLALEQLETLAKIPAGPSYGDLALNPKWDSLRQDPRFVAILDALRPAASASTVTAEPWR